MPPDELGLEGGETLEDALGNEADLNMPMIGRQLAADAAAIFFGLTVEELIALPALDREGGKQEGNRVRPQTSDNLISEA